MALKIAIAKGASEFLGNVFKKLADEARNQNLGQSVPEYVPVPMPQEQQEQQEDNNKEKDNNNNNNSKDAASPSSSPRRYDKVPEIVTWATKAAVVLLPNVATSTLQVGYNASKKDCLEVFNENIINMCKWYAFVALAIIELKTTIIFNGKENLASLSQEELAENLSSSKLLSALNSAGDDTFSTPPPDYEEIVINGDCPELDLAVTRTAKNVYQYAEIKAPYYDSMYESEATAWLEGIAGSSLFFSVPYFILVLRGVVNVTVDIPESQEDRVKALGPFCPRRYTEAHNRYISMGHDLGTAPQLTSGSQVTAVSDYLMKIAFGTVDPSGHNYSQTPGFVDSFSHVTPGPEGADLIDGKSLDITLVPWQTYRVLLNWFGGGVFSPLVTRTEPEDGITMSIVRPVTYKIFVPDPTKVDEYSPVSVTFELTTRDYELTFAEVIRKSINEGIGLYSTSRYHTTDQDDSTRAIVEECKNFILKCLDAQLSKEVEQPLIEIRSGVKPNEYDSEIFEDLSANANAVILKKERLSDCRSLNFCIIEAGTHDKYTSSTSRHGGGGSSSSHQSGNTNPGWDGGVFSPLFTRTEPEDGITMSIVRPVTYEIFVPDPTKNIRKALENKNIEDVKKTLHYFDVTATDNEGRTCLHLAGSHSSSLEVVKLIFEKIVEAGDTALLKSQLTATTSSGWTCLMAACRNSSPEVVKLVFDKINEAGGPDLVTSQLTATTNLGSTCLLLACRDSSSPDVVKLVLEKILEAGDIALLKSQLTATVKDHWTCLMHACSFKSSPEVVKLLAVVLFKLDLFKQQHEKLCNSDKNRLKEMTGIDSSSWTPDVQCIAEIKSLLPDVGVSLRSNPSKLPNFLAHFPDYVADFFNNEVLPSGELTDFFATPFVVNTLTRIKLEGSLPHELHAISNILLRKTLAKFDEIEMNQEPASRASILQEVLDERHHIAQLAFQDLTVTCHESFVTSLFKDFHDLYINFFNQKLQLEETESRHQNHLEELEQFRQLQHFELQQHTLTQVQDCQNEESDVWNFFFLEIVAQQYQLETCCLEIVEQFIEEENVARNELSKEFRQTLQTLQVENDRKTAPLRRICTKHDIPLPESVIQKLTSENVMESGEFELLDSARLDGMNIGKDDRLKVLKLANVYKNEAFVEMRTRYSELANQNQEMQRRLRLNNELGSLQQEKISLIMKLLDSQEKNKWLDSMNYSMNMNNATLDELQQAIDDLGNENADLAKIVGEQRSASSQLQTAVNAAPAPATAPETSDGGDDQSAVQDITSSEQRSIDAFVEAKAARSEQTVSETFS